MQSLAYLWGYDQAQLVKEMIQKNITAIIVKICSYGLKESHLGKTLQENYDDFISLRDQYGFNMAGEGGEYESLTLDCPLYKKRIEITEKEIVKH